jgi:hypothetical protein
LRLKRPNADVIQHQSRPLVTERAIDAFGIWRVEHGGQDKFDSWV